MKITALGACGGTALVALVWMLAGHNLPAVAQRPPGADPAASLITLTTPLPDGRQQLTVIDPHSRAMGVYHVDPTTGAVTLKSVRNLHWDLQMDEFNGTSPLPREIRNLLETR